MRTRAYLPGGSGAKERLTVLVLGQELRKFPTASRHRSYLGGEVRTSLWKQKRYPQLRFDYDAAIQAVEDWSGMVETVHHRAAISRFCR